MPLRPRQSAGSVRRVCTSRGQRAAGSVLSMASHAGKAITRRTKCLASQPVHQRQRQRPRNLPSRARRPGGSPRKRKRLGRRLPALMKTRLHNPFTQSLPNPLLMPLLQQVFCLGVSSRTLLMICRKCCFSSIFFTIH